jgi:uncharacterized protein YqeY
MRNRDRVAASALRTVLGAIENAEAVPTTGPAPSSGGLIAGAISGLGAGEVPRRTLTPGEVEAIVRAEVDERRRAAAEYDGLGRSEQAARLRQEAGLIEVHLS